MPADVEGELCSALHDLAPDLDALIVMDQAGVPGCGVITPPVLKTVRELSVAYPRLVILADSRHGLGSFPPLVFKMNAAEFTVLTAGPKNQRHVIRDVAPGAAELPLADLLAGADRLAAASKRAVFITLAERGIIGAAPSQPAVNVPALPLRGEIDIVGAGDAVTAALTLALAAGATLGEAMQLAQAAASLVIHQLGTTGLARVAEVRKLLFP
jgi:fructose-1-phosphate kinase PfkB-like protein